MLITELKLKTTPELKIVCSNPTPTRCSNFPVKTKLNNHSISQEMSQELPSMTVHRQGMDELNHYHPHVAKEMTELTRLTRDHLIKPYSPSL